MFVSCLRCLIAFTFLIVCDVVCGSASYCIADDIWSVRLKTTMSIKRRVAEFTAAERGEQAKKALIAASESKLSPILIATRDSGGVLLGRNPETGEAVFKGSAETGERLSALAVADGSRLLREQELPPKLNRVKKLSLIYRPGAEPPAQSLAKLEQEGFQIEPAEVQGKTYRVLFASPKDREWVELTSNIAKIVESLDIDRADCEFEVAVRLDPLPTSKSRRKPPTNNRRDMRLPFSESGTVTAELRPAFWGLERIGAARKQLDKEALRKIVVAVVDTGVHHEHQDLSEAMWSDQNGHFGYDFVNHDSDPDDDHGHGTHVAGIIGAIPADTNGVSGVAPGVRLMAVKVLRPQYENGRLIANGEAEWIHNGLQYAIQHGATVINCSWGSSAESQLIRLAIEEAQMNNIIVVAAAGNGDKNGVGMNIDELPFYPASYSGDYVVAVSALQRAEPGEAGELTSFSNFGARTVLLAAPGEQILSCGRDGGRVMKDGTSMAAPHVAGAVAILKTMPEYEMASPSRMLAALAKQVRKSENLRTRVSTSGELTVADINGSSTTPEHRHPYAYENFSWRRWREPQVRFVRQSAVLAQVEIFLESEQSVVMRGNTSVTADLDGTTFQTGFQIDNEEDDEESCRYITVSKRGEWHSFSPVFAERLSQGKHVVRWVVYNVERGGVTFDSGTLVVEPLAR